MTGCLCPLTSTPRGRALAPEFRRTCWRSHGRSAHRSDASAAAKPKAVRPQAIDDVEIPW